MTAVGQNEKVSRRAFLDRCTPESGRSFERGERQLRADIVAKVFWASQRETLIQDRTRMRNIDSKARKPRFDCFKFLFHSVRSATFATQSANSGHRARYLN